MNTTYKKTSTSTFIILIIMILCGFQFYQYFDMTSNQQRYPELVMVVLLAAFTAKQIFSKEKDLFFRLMRLLLFSWIFSMFMAVIFWGQSTSRTFVATGPCLFFIIFFYFCKKKVSRLSLEKITVIFGWLYIILWLYSLTRIPEATFGWSKDGELSDDMSRGIIRINFTGRLSMIFAYFYYLNKSFLERNPKYKIFAVTFFVFLVFQVTRQLILWTGVVTIIFIFLRARKLASILGVVFLFLYLGSANIHFSDDSIIGSLANITNEEANGQLYSGENPRITEYRYFMTKWSKNAITDIFGNGVPHGANAYGQYEERLKSNGIFLSDVGYPSMYVYVGLVGLILYILLFFKCTFQKLPKELAYVNMYMGFMIPANIAASWYATPDSQLAMSICVYFIYMYHKHPEFINLKDNGI